MEKTLEYFMESSKGLNKFNKQMEGAVLRENKYDSNSAAYLSVAKRQSHIITRTIGSEESFTEIAHNILVNNIELIPIFEKAISLAKGKNILNK
jgi:hypothetical protein